MIFFADEIRFHFVRAAINNFLAVFFADAWQLLQLIERRGVDVNEIGLGCSRGCGGFLFRRGLWRICNRKTNADGETATASTTSIDAFS